MRKALRILLYTLATLALVVIALNWTLGRLPAEPKPRGSFVTVDGVRIHYLERAGGEAFDPQPIEEAHKHRALAINMTSGNLKAYAGEELEANDVFARIDPRLGSIDVPAIVIQGERDKLVKPRYGRRLAALLPDARLEMIHGGHMAPYTHPYAIAAAVRAVEAGAWPRLSEPAPRASG